MMAPLVSVVLPTYNSARYLPETISAILGQTFSDLELIVVDDGSTDDTAEIVAGFADRLTYVWQENSGGPSKPRNVGVRLATGQFVAFCDSDDVLTPTAIADALEVFAGVPDIDLVWGDFDTIDKNGQVLKERGMDRYQEFREDFTPAGLDQVYLMDRESIYSRILRGLFLGMSSVVVRQSVLEAVGPFDETLRNSDDREMWLKIAREKHGFSYVDRVRFLYRRHSASVTTRGHLRLPSVIRNLERQLPFLEDGPDRDFILRRINGCRLGYAWGLRKEKKYAEAEKAYREALSESWSWAGLKGLLATWVQKTI